MKRLSIRLLIGIFIAFFFVCTYSLQISAESQNIYTTWENMEIDKCASAWLIKRIIDKNAGFEFFPKGELITKGIPFDVPEAKIRRYHNMSAFEYLLKKHNLTEPALRKIGKIIHDIEINYWGKKEMQESLKINEDIRKIIENSETPEDIFKKSFIYFDKLYSEMRP